MNAIAAPLLILTLCCACTVRKPAPGAEVEHASASGRGPAGPDDKRICRNEEVVGST